MKQRRTKILALFLAATMAVGSPVTAFSVSAEDWASADEIAGFEDGFEDSGEETDTFSAEEEAIPEASEDVAEDTEGTDEFYSFGDETEDLTSSDVALADLAAGKAYSVKTTVLNSSGTVSGMYEMENVVITLQEDGTYLVRMHQKSANREVLALTNDGAKASAHTIPWYEGTGDGYEFTVPVASLSDTLYFCMIKKASAKPGAKFSNIQTLTFDLSSIAESSASPAVSSDISVMPGTVAEEKADYTAVDAALALIPADLSVYTDESVAAVNAAKDAIVRDYGKDKQAEVDKMAADLKAAVEALILKENPAETTELAITNGTKMFKVTKAVLQKYESGQKLLLTLSSTGYEYLFKGTYEEAAANGNNRDNWIKFEKTDAGYQFEIPVSEGETKISLVSVSKSKLAEYEKGTAALEKAFYPRQVVIDYDAKTLVSGDFDHTVSLAVTNNVKMFTVKDASLHTVGGPNSNGYKETLELTMGSTSFDQIYVGSAEDAKKTESTIAISGTKASVLMKENITGGTTVLDYLEKPVTLSFHSVKKDQWYERVFTVSKKNGTVKIVDHVPATEVKLDVDAKELIEGEFFDLTAVVSPENTSDLLVWSTSDEKVAAVADGKVTAVGAGKAVITATVGNAKAECQIIVNHVSEVIPAKEATCTRTGLTEGAKCSICGEIVKEQEVIPALGHKEVVLPAVAATCTKDGWSEGKKCSVCGIILKARKLVKATGHKEVVIPAVAATQGHTGLTEGKKCSVCGEILEAQKTTPALPILVTKVTVSAKNSVKVAAGRKVQLQVKTAPSNADNSTVTWKSSNTKVAAVNAKGVVTMKKNAGGKSVVITATAKDSSKVYGSIKLTCMKGYVKKITISGKKTVKKGKTLKLKANVTASSKANKSVVWSSSNTKVATVSSKGVVKGKKKGTVTITVRSLDGTNKKATIKIKVK